MRVFGGVLNFAEKIAKSSLSLKQWKRMGLELGTVVYHSGERTVRIRKVVGSNPFRSTIIVLFL